MYTLSQFKGLTLSAGSQVAILFFSFILPKPHNLGLCEFSDGFCSPLLLLQAYTKLPGELSTKGKPDITAPRGIWDVLAACH